MKKFTLTVFGILVVTTSIGACGISSVSVPHPLVDGIPLHPPILVHHSAHQTILPMVAWRWGKRSMHQTKTGAFPWNIARFNLTDSTVLSWRPSVPPNMVHVILIQHLLRPNQPLRPANIIRACSLNVSYPQNHGCTLFKNGRIRLHWNLKRSSHPVGLIISALWTPAKPAGATSTVDHQATWIAQIH